jgi:hypothetical protein
VRWTDGYKVVREYIGQNEVDARAKYYSLDEGPIAKILVTNGTIVLNDRPSTDGICAIVIGAAVGDGDLPIRNSSSAFSVIAQENGDHTENYHLNHFESSLDAGIQYGTWDGKGTAAAIINASGSLIKRNRDFTDCALRQALGYYTVYSTLQGRV